MRRRDVLAGGLAVSGTALVGARAPALIGAESARPTMPYGPMSGDVLTDRAMIWGAADRPARMVVEWSRDAGFRKVERRIGPLATVDSGLAAKLDLTGLPPGGEIHYRVAFQDPDNARLTSAWSEARLRLPDLKPRPVRFTFSGDEAGQGFGINPELGGYRLYEAMRQVRPDFFIHLGDQIYADNPLKEEVKLADGGTWRNLVTPAKARTAETLDDFRGNFAYNLLDRNKRAFLAEVPMLAQWDDHEVRNNWFPDKAVQSGPPIRELAAHARQAMVEFNPMRLLPGVSGVERSFAMGPLLEVFLLDARSYRGGNAEAASPKPGAGLYGERQIAWLKQGLARSRAVWKVIGCEMPLSLTVKDLMPDVPPGGIEAMANGLPGAPGGREGQLADLLSFIRAQNIANTVWLSADVHFPAAVHYHPDRAAFRDFLPFWEIVAGPINAGTFSLSLNPPDPTFGPEVVYTGVPEPLPDISPRAGLQFFGMGEIDPQSHALTLSIRDIAGRVQWSKVLEAERR
ncbi:alkaline phosphatase D family protein [Novosphingobium sp. G106]|uniref:alkaline phosphatase D family protein n=1 Tax=Novosphingobium sp. G106 TaxID=2849500 RepID=UPI001C2DAABD|nr:alkaline phosphatase D family protein [Novosphingobium sp. G106]MBV1689824.1 alkaline phosphatase D family protein [Novosphingobium sp. G106]